MVWRNASSVTGLLRTTSTACRLRSSDFDQSAKAGQHDHRDVLIHLFDKARGLIAAHLRHDAIEDDEIELVPPKFFQRLATARRRRNRMSVTAQISRDHFEDAGFVIDNENVQRRLRSHARKDWGLQRRSFRLRQADDEGRPLPRGGFNFQFAAMPLDDAVNHGKPEAGAALAFRREKWLEAALADSFRHAGPGIAHANDRVVAFGRGLERNAAAFRHRIDGVENQIGQHLTQRGLLTRDKGRCLLHRH